MRLLSLRDFQFEPGDFLCCESRTGRAAALIAFGLAGVAFGLVAWFIEQAAKPAFLTSLCCVFYIFSNGPGVWRGWRANPWVVCMRQSGLALNLRSYRNADRLDSDLVVVWLDWKEIHSVAEARVELRLPDPDNWRDRRSREQYLDVELTQAPGLELERALQREFASSSARRAHYFAPTLRLFAARRIRICWKDELRALHPPLSEALVRLMANVPTQDLERSSIDWRELRSDEIENLLYERFSGGHHLQVVRLLRKQRGWNRKQAERFVEELSKSARNS